MANIGRAYCRIMPTAAALLRDILRKKKEKKKVGRPVPRKAKTKRPGVARPADVQDVACYKCLRIATRRSSFIHTDTNFGVTRNANATYVLRKKQLGNGNLLEIILTSAYRSAGYVLSYRFIGIHFYE